MSEDSDTRSFDEAAKPYRVVESTPRTITLEMKPKRLWVLNLVIVIPALALVYIMSADNSDAWFFMPFGFVSANLVFMIAFSRQPVRLCASPEKLSTSFRKAGMFQRETDYPREDILSLIAVAYRVRFAFGKVEAQLVDGRRATIIRFGRRSVKTALQDATIIAKEISQRLGIPLAS